jgi:hypothetical protein
MISHQGRREGLAIGPGLVLEGQTSTDSEGRPEQQVVDRLWRVSRSMVERRRAS